MPAIPPTPVLPASAWDAPAPVLFNAWKHHSAALRRRVRAAVEAGPAGLDDLAAQMVVIGTELMDLYHGRFTPAEIGERFLEALPRDGRLGLEAYRAWVAGNGGYAGLPLV